MTDAIARSFAYQLEELIQYLQANYDWKSPDGGFAIYVFYRTEGKLPFSVNETALILEEGQKRLREAPILAALGYEIAAGRVVDAKVLEAWANGFSRLSEREVFLQDRNSFFYRPIELLGISLGAKHCPNISSETSNWLREIFIQGEDKNLFKNSRAHLKQV
jgi:hypothetical protein